MGAHSNSLLGAEGHFDVDHDHHDHAENDAIRKHQVLNSDKTIIKDRTSGVNDVEGFHQSNEHSERDHFGAGVSGIASENIGSSTHSDKDLDHDFGPIGASENLNEASGAGVI